MVLYIDVWDLIKLTTIANLLDVSWFLGPKETLKRCFKGIRPYWCLRVIFRKKALIIENFVVIEYLFWVTMMLVTNFDLKLHQKCFFKPSKWLPIEKYKTMCKLIDLHNLNIVFKQRYLNIVEIFASRVQGDCCFSWVQGEWCRFVYLF